MRLRRYVLIALFLVLVSAAVTYSILIWEVPAPKAGESQSNQQMGLEDHRQSDPGTKKNQDELIMDSKLFTQSPVGVEDIQINTARPKMITQLILERYYKLCQHTEVEEMDHTSPLITLPRQELLNLYPGWVVKEDLAGRLILRREINDLCPKDLKKRFVGEKDGLVTIFYGAPGMKSKVFRRTEIAVAGLPLQIKAQLKKGIPSESDSHLISIIEGLEAYYGE